VVFSVILAGGIGERFWPLSRKKRPKQFLRLTSDKMMLEETIDRILPLIPMERVKIVTGDTMHKQILENCNDIHESNIISEPVGRNTGPAIVLAAAHLYKEDPDAIMVVLSADHLIRPPEKLRSILSTATKIAAHDDALITIGIVPTRPETGYGYIKMGDLFRQENGYSVHIVSSFTEKPRAAVASEYYYSNEYLWNSGMFVWSARAILDAFAICQPEMYELISAYQEKIGTPDEQKARKEFYDKVEGVSIDVAILEKASNVMTIKADIIWDDVGDWRALERYKEMDRDNNIIVGDVVAETTYENTICNHSDGLIACLGVSDLIIVRSENITLVTHRTKAQEIKSLLKKLSEDDDYKKYL